MKLDKKTSIITVCQRSEPRSQALRREGALRHRRPQEDAAKGRDIPKLVHLSDRSGLM